MRYVQKSLQALAIISLGGCFHQEANAKRWQGTAQLGASASHGNTEQYTLLSQLEFHQQTDRWRHELEFDVFQARSLNKNTAHRFSLGYAPKYFWSEQAYLFGLMQYDSDDSARIDHRYTVITGGGYALSQEDVWRYTTELGLGGKQTKLTNDSGVLDDVVAYLSFKYRQSLNENTLLDMSLRADLGEDNTTTKIALGISAKMSETISMKVGLDFRNNNKITGKRGKNTDTTTKVSLVKTF